MSDARFKVGDVVKVKTAKEIGSLGATNPVFVREMTAHCGLTTRIGEVILKEDGSIHSSRLEGCGWWYFDEKTLDPVLIVGGLVRIKTIEEIAKEYPEYMNFDDDTLMQECTLGHGFVNGMYQHSNMIMHVDKIELAKAALNLSLIQIYPSLKHNVSPLKDLGTFQWNLYMVEYYDGSDTMNSPLQKEDKSTCVISSLKANAKFRLSVSL